jgi:hypothetical protein
MHHIEGHAAGGGAGGAASGADGRALRGARRAPRLRSAAVLLIPSHDGRYTHLFKYNKIKITRLGQTHQGRTTVVADDVALPDATLEALSTHVALIFQLIIIKYEYN